MAPYAAFLSFHAGSFGQWRRRKRFFPKPAWQAGIGVPSDGYRDVPDISFNASGHTGYEVVEGPLGGRRQYLVRPLYSQDLNFAESIRSLEWESDAAGSGNVNPRIYQMAAAVPSAFHDVTSGNNIVPCYVGPDCTTGSFGYTAGPRYDLTTGWGSLDVNTFFQNWQVATSTCSYAANLADRGQGFPPGGTGTITITTGPGCPWTVTATPAGIMLTSPASGSGSGTSTFLASPNSGGRSYWVSNDCGSWLRSVSQPAETSGVLAAEIVNRQQLGILLSASIGSHLRANFFRSRQSHPLPHLHSPLLQSLPACPARPFHPHPHNPNVVRACAGRSLQFGEIRARRKKRASRPGNIEKRAGHGRESILWLIRTSRKRREVTVKGNRRAQLTVDSDTFLRPEPAQALIPCAG